MNVLHHVLANAIGFALPALAFAQETASADERSFVANLILVLLPLTPLVLIVLLLAWLVKRSGAMRQGAYLERGWKHMEMAEAHIGTLESKLDRMIELLESIEELQQELPQDSQKTRRPEAS